jgi:hypothetical protein
VGAYIHTSIERIDPFVTLFIDRYSPSLLFGACRIDVALQI